MEEYLLFEEIQKMDALRIGDVLTAMQRHGRTVYRRPRRDAAIDRLRSAEIPARRSKTGQMFALPPPGMYR